MCTPLEFGSARIQRTLCWLVICKELVQRCHGDISIESQLSRGTTVTFTLPATSINLQTDIKKEIIQPDVMLELKTDMEKLGQLSDEFIQLCTSTLIPGYDDVRSVLSLERLEKFAHDVEDAGLKHDVMSFVSSAVIFQI